MFRKIRKLSTGIILTRMYMKNSFKKAFDKYLIWTNIGSSAIMLVGGDIIQQEMEYRKKKIHKRYDYKRTGRMFLVGLVLGPVHHYFYKYLDFFLPKQDIKTVGKKILVDQFVAAPLFIFSFFYGMGLLEHRNFPEIKQELKDKFLIVYTGDWLVWPPTQFINFYYLDPKYRVLYINFITMIYDVFLSYVKHNDQHQALPMTNVLDK